MVKAKLRRKAERAERAGKALARSSGGGGATTAEDGLGVDAAAGSHQVEDEMSRLTDHHRRKVKKRAAFLESAYTCVGLGSFKLGFVGKSGDGAGVEEGGVID